MKNSKYPIGWDSKRVEKVLEHYESQSEDEAVVEDESAFEMEDKHKKGYERKPVSKSEFSIWESEQEWVD